uniref:uncharacterized protein LOC120346956 n=1 Tax=Styela clava TaxID=7725 RepID=UPI00193A853F|nr:uncharacterized protein LOC120346956 [Styela clava]
MNGVIEETKQREVQRSTEDKLNMWKHSNLFNCKWLFMQIIAYSINSTISARCTECSNTILGTESKNITYGPSNEYNCNCDWTIPEDMDTDHETAVVLLLKKFSFPRTTDSGSTHCSGEIRFPSTDGYKCDFPSNYCLAFATASIICNINKIREKIPDANHTCDSIIPWNEAGGSPYKIQYNSRGYAGYTKYFTIQYLVIDCRPTTTPALTTVTEQATTIATHPKDTSSYETFSTTESTRTTGNIQCPNEECECTSTQVSQNTEESENTIPNYSQTSLIIAILVSGIVGLIIGALLMFIISRFYNNNNDKKPKNKDSMEMGSIQHQQPNVHERTTYENYTPTSNESGYEVPNQVNNKNEQSGYEVPNPVDNKNERSGYEVPNQVDNKNEQQYEVIITGKEYQYDN